ncbi:alpha/beta fold hydrolase [Aeromicrobium duanguangcaii]|uniref:Alpha/beta hydrolase n=1 Tax=Aeromicrobium duanguangcaii TaxID=2968086 RepID=A0ABY5KH15_9ACTN|nr:alpha/beta hydrolase [Aeromicrobium duanguangcaii]MCD9155397.1 alpha/beta hydrolase [Aeromicrobium duanguangcaii]MCL3838365.1 alpha/beta hydrolase [Aeromicrobium duanguangcaii]UUI68331.1 alpha/beta hydrolase [Aeromicrobium duanguangcaii]
MTSPTLPVVPGVEHRWIDVDGVRLHVAEAGRAHQSVDRPSVLLVHGWPQHWFCWRHVMPALAETHHVVAVDLRGSGWSDVPEGEGAYDKRVMADEIARAIEELGLDRPVVVGHDWGAWISLLVASRHEGLTRGVVAAAIVAPWADLPLHEMWRFAYQPIVGGPGGAFLQRAGGQVVLKTLFKLGAGPGYRWQRSDREEYLARFREPARARAGRELYRTFMLKEIPKVGKGYARRVEEIPLLFLPGTADTVLAPSLVRRAEGPPNVTVTPISGSGHWIPEEKPAELVGQIRDFLRQF